MSLAALFYRHCDGCDSDYHERVFEDSYTGLSFCLMCLSQGYVVNHITMSPSEDGDNLLDAMVERGVMEQEQVDQIKRERLVA